MQKYDHKIGIFMEEPNSSPSAERCGEQHISLGNSTRKRSKKTTSVVWEQFDKVNIDGKLKAKCKDCGKTYSCEYGTTNLHRHVNMTHGLVVLDEESERLRNIHQPVSLRHAEELLDDKLEGVPSLYQHVSLKHRQELHDDKFQRLHLDQVHYHELMARAVIKHSYPFEFAEHDGIHEIHTYLNPEVQFISRDVVKDDVLGIYRKEKERFKHALESVPSRISLTFDLWFSITLDGYFLLTAHFVDENWMPQSKILNLRFIPPPHQGPLLAEKVIDLLEEWGIGGKLFGLTLDDASKNNGLVDVVKNHLRLTGNLICEGEYFHVHCGARILNSIVQSVLKVIETCVNKVRQSVKYVKGTKGRLLRFAKCVAQLSLKCNKKLRDDASTNWNSTYLMLDSVLPYKLAFRQFQYVDTDFKDCVTDEEWRKIEKICRFLKPFHDISTLFLNDEYPTADLYFPGIWKIQSLINAEMQDRNNILYGVATEMKAKFKKYWDCYSLILSFAIVLDPRYKMEFVEFVLRKLYPTNFIEKLTYIRGKMDKLYEEYSRLCAYPSTSTPSSLRFSSADNEEDIDDMDDFDSFLNQKHVFDSSKSQLDSYLEESRLDRKLSLDVPTYWKTNRSKYTVLSVMAQDVLSVPITTAASETSFGGQAIAKYFSSITPENAENMEALICTQSWLYGSNATGGEEQKDDHLVTDMESLIAALDSSDN